MLAWGIPRYLVEHYYWVCLWGCLGKRLASESADWVKKTCPHQWGGHHSIHSVTSIEQKRRGGANSLSSWAGASVFSYSAILELQVLGPSDLDQDLHYELGRSWAILASIMAWANSYNRSPLYIYLYISCQFCFFGESRLICVWDGPFSCNSSYSLVSLLLKAYWSSTLTLESECQCSNPDLLLTLNKSLSFSVPQFPHL